MTRHDSHYEPPAAEVIPTNGRPSMTAAGVTDVYGAITLMEDDGKTRRKRRRRRILSRKRSSGE